MNSTERAKLNTLLRALISAQDDVTHYNEAGDGFTVKTRAALAKRDRARQRIILFCDGLGRQ
jgi:hypothetical protein